MSTKILRHHTYWAVFFMAFYSSLPAYINSSFLSQRVSAQAIGLVYSASSILIILAILKLNYFLNRFGLLTTTIFLSVLASLVILPLVLGGPFWLVIGTFIIYLALGSIIRYQLDIYLENISNNANTGAIRAWSLTALNIAWLGSPLLAAWLLGVGNYALVFLISALTLLPFILLLTFFMTEYFPQPNSKANSIFYNFYLLRSQKNQNSHDLKNILLIDFALNFFYSLMVIYMPLYLHTKIGLTWTEIGFAFSIMLLPFVLFEIPLGRLADKVYGEKEILIAGLTLTGLATIVAGLFSGSNWIWWAVILFATRTGAASVEIMKETYLFKKINSQDIAIIGLSRLNSPLASLVGPLLGGLILLVANFHWLFVLLGIFILTMIINAYRLVDTR
ncbi:MAG: hypothetical protein COX02_01965 [Candidatus Vogelbacteria bacterium CG22_combo_CG10-13_8_21_14_all_37_9]|uniref:Major facilitator superfamily (MFS) profile domain-containing protein n=1 Tax=Candidatus Vogelbacteria bacterium CG22_combo_CG10-13_8_21_14_all_37_9 TaxID=1975046 RepID=A0A2H0BKP8_9BACT|nr:MAG: hypothetical protein BK005_00865 [bacterium CG10_37_50]PIP58119.1 MAG: hypothetical protein COX02_01965 [Candidatus Vogelbacteria bacterium CG22_combo_CG10-13_8_21_14_all_37_9]